MQADNHCGWRFLGGAVLSAALAGCGAGSPSMATLDGVVMVNSNPTTSGVVVFFDPATGDGASAPLNDKGEFKMNGSVRVGKYAVAFQPPPLPPPLAMESGRAARPSLEVPAKFQSTETSDMMVDVHEGSNTLTIDFKH